MIPCRRAPHINIDLAISPAPRPSSAHVRTIATHVSGPAPFPSVPLCPSLSHSTWPSLLSQLLRAITVPVSVASLRLRATRRARSPSGLVVYDCTRDNYPLRHPFSSLHGHHDHILPRFHLTLLLVRFPYILYVSHTIPLSFPLFPGIVVSAHSSFQA